jgi:NAD(P)-dependent dehydrogenase (short-subunit alcohol dehydrogenase family)
MSPLAPRFDQRTAIVTGAAQGIGLATAQRLRDEGATVHGFDLRIPDDEPGISWYEMNVTDLDRWNQLVAEIAGPERRIDVLVNNAGLVGSYESLVDITLDDWKRIIDINQNGTGSSTDCGLCCLTWSTLGAGPSSTSRRCGG